MNQLLQRSLRHKIFIKASGLLLILLLIFVSVSDVSGQSVGISSTSITPDPSSILELRTTAKGLLVPRMNTTERDAITSPANGLVIYNTQTNLFNFYNGTIWASLVSGSSGINSVTGTSNRIVISGTANDPVIDISSSYAGQSSITTLGTIATGTWSGTVIADNKIASILTGKTYNGLTLTSAATGFTIAGGTTSKTLTVPLDATVSGTNTGDQTITLTGDVTGSGTGSFATAIGNGKITNAMLAGSIDLATKITGTLPIANGGTGQTSASNAFNALSPVTTLGDLIFGSGTNTNTRLAGNTTATKKFLTQTGNGTISAAPSWDALTSSDVGLGNVENTALSTWAGSANITTLGTIATGTWSGTVIADNKIASILTGKTYNGLTLTSAATGFTIAGGTTSKTLTVPLDATVSGTNTGDQTITLTGDVTGSGTGSFATTIGNAKVTNAMLAGSIDLTTKVTNTLPIANGGTNATGTPTNGGVTYGNGTAYQFTAAGNDGEVLQSTGAGAPVWVEGGTMMLTGTSNNTAVSNTALFYPVMGSATGTTTDAQAGLRTLMARPGTIKGFYVKLSAALAAGKTGNVTVYKNGVATALVATLSVGPTLFSDLTNSITVAAGDEIGVKVTTTGNVKFSWAVNFTY